MSHPLDPILKELRDSLDRIAADNGGSYVDKAGIPAPLALLTISKLIEDGSRMVNELLITVKGGKVTKLKVADENIHPRFYLEDMYNEMMKSLTKGEGL